MFLNTLVSNLFDSHFRRDLLALMGDVTGSNWAEAKAKYETYKKEGKEAQDINRIYEEEILEKMKSKFIIFLSNDWFQLFESKS